MKLEMLAIWDDKAKAYMQPYFMLNKALGVRTFANAVNTAGAPLNVNAEDYTLFSIGTFDDSDGSVTLHPTGAELLVSARQVKAPQ